MPMPMWWRSINKRFFNPGALRRGSWPVLRHVGRSSGKRYRTPIGANRKEDGFIFIVVYGPESDWVQNVLASGRAVLEIDGDEVELTSPRLVSIDEAFGKLPASTARPPNLIRISQCLEMDVAPQSAEGVELPSGASREESARL